MSGNTVHIPKSGKTEWGPTQPSYGEYGINPKTGTLLQIGDDEVFCPPAKMLRIQPRTCGDFYAELDAHPLVVAGHGPTAADAVQSAIARLAERERGQ